MKPGDTWDINFICLELGIGFTEDFADRVNIVRLTDVKKNVQLENIATLEYLLTEKVSGSMTNPMTKQTIPTEMDCSYVGHHDFNIDQGRCPQNLKTIKIQNVLQFPNSSILSRSNNN